MSAFDRLKSSVAVIAALMAGMVLLAGAANATDRTAGRRDGARADAGYKAAAGGTRTTSKPVDSGKGAVAVSNGVATSRLLNGPNGLTAAVNSSGTITISNGTSSVTFIGGAAGTGGAPAKASTMTQN